LRHSLFLVPVMSNSEPHLSKPEKRIHLRIVIGGIILMIACAVWVFGFGGMGYVGRAVPIP
jgi:hypothetical protein